MVKYGEGFFTSLGFAPAARRRSGSARSSSRRSDRDVVCHASAWDVDSVGRPAPQDVHPDHRRRLPHRSITNSATTSTSAPTTSSRRCFRDSANDGFHEAIGDTIALSVTPEYLVKLGLLDKAPDASKDIGLLLHKALEKIAFLPFGLVIDQWRWKVFSGEITPDKYNQTWWPLRQKYQGIAPPVDRSESDFDPGAKYHVAANVPYMRYFLADILQFQFHRALSQTAGCTGPLEPLLDLRQQGGGGEAECHAGNGREPSLAGGAGEDRRHARDGCHRHPRLLRAAAEMAG